MALAPLYSLKKPHVTVLIDGDGAIFDESYLFNSVQGGATAAQLLDQGIRHYLWGENDHLQTCDMYAYMFLNKQGLAGTMAECYKDDPRYKPNMLDDFLAGFTQHRLFIAADAGRLFQAADTKIFERLQVEIESAEDIIFVGVAHDHGYEYLIKQYPGYEAFKHKLHLLKTYKGKNNQLNVLQMFEHRVFRIDDLFIKDKIVSSPSQSPRRGLAAHAYPQYSLSFGQDSVAMPNFNRTYPGL
ncbi:hypothetical protein MD484_g3706, partial [Candolleomyces efflorescens]